MMHHHYTDDDSISSDVWKLQEIFYGKIRDQFHHHLGESILILMPVADAPDDGSESQGTFTWR